MAIIIYWSINLDAVHINLLNNACMHLRYRNYLAQNKTAVRTREGLSPIK